MAKLLELTAGFSNDVGVNNYYSGNACGTKEECLNKQRFAKTKDLVDFLKVAYMEKNSNRTIVL
jgi:hypothetical protein